ncbi:MAG: metal-dependent hydrolase [Methylibium sp.]
MNGPTHRVVAGTAVGLFLSDRETKAGVQTFKPVLNGAAAALFTNLPDILEPATSPNHRAFFHSLAFATLLGIGLHRLHSWQAETDAERFWKSVGMVAGSAYLIHLALDFTTRRSLPLLGRC